MTGSAPIRLAFDFEFEDRNIPPSVLWGGLKPRTMVPISVAVVVIDDPTGPELLLENPGYAWDYAPVWLQQNVRPHLVGGAHEVPVWRWPYLIEAFVADARVQSMDSPVEWWGDSPAYDWVLLSSFWGHMTNRPAPWGYDAFNIRQEAATLARCGVDVGDLVYDEDTLHGALADAHTVRSRVLALDEAVANVAAVLGAHH